VRQDPHGCKHLGRHLRPDRRVCLDRCACKLEILLVVKLGEELQMVAFVIHDADLRRQLPG
jgi:hypothetical protein